MLLKAKDLGYTIHSFRDWVNKSISGPRTLLVRHDVDLSLEKARRMMEVERGLGVNSTYFLRLHSRAYQLLTPENYQILMEFLGADVDLALHYELFFYRTIGGNPMEMLAKDVRVLEGIVGKPVTGCAAHLPTLNKNLVMDTALAVGLAYEAYGSPFTRERKYISDSSRHWREGCLCQWLGKADHITVLIHPIWWFELEQTPEEIIAYVQAGN